MVNSQFPERAEMEPSSEPPDFAEKSDKDSLILELKERLSALLLKNEKLEEEVLNLKEKNNKRSPGATRETRGTTVFS